MDDNPLFGLVLFIIFIIISGFMYAFGEAIRAISESGLERKLEEGDRKSKKILSIIEKPNKFINTVHLVSAVTVALVGFFQLRSFGTGCIVWLTDRIGRYFIDEVIYVIAYLLVGLYLLFLVISLGIIVPKKLGIKYSESVSRLFLGPVCFLMKVLTPFTWFISFFAGLVLRVIGIDPNEELVNVTEDEIISIVNEGHEQGVLEEREAEMISNIIELDTKTVDDIMIHRKNVVAVDGTWTLNQAVQFVIEQNYSRFPVYIDDLDNIIGILHIRKAMEFYHKGEFNDTALKDIRDILMEAKFIPESRDIDDLLKDMQQTKVHMDIVVDEYGQTSGIITMEDIIEEIVGNIFDEYDIEEHNIVQEAEGVYIIKGMTTLEEMGDVLGEEFEDENYDTLNGYLISKLERIPEPDEKPELVIDKYNYKILSIDNKMISLVKVTKLPVEESDEKNESEE